jgi:hypothetical protein
VPYDTRAPKELATPSADPRTAPTFCFRGLGSDTAGARGSRLLDRRPPHYRCPAVPGLQSSARAILTVPAPPFFPLGSITSELPVRAPAAGAFTGVLITDFAAARQFIPARPYCLSELREKLYPRNRRKSSPAIVVFSMFEAEVICSTFPPPLQRDADTLPPSLPHPGAAALCRRATTATTACTNPWPRTQEGSMLDSARAAVKIGFVWLDHC